MALLDKSGAAEMVKLPPLLGRFLCWLGFHDFRVVDVTFLNLVQMLSKSMNVGDVVPLELA